MYTERKSEYAPVPPPPLMHGAASFTQASRDAWRNAYAPSGMCERCADASIDETVRTDAAVGAFPCTNAG